jgi:PrcB C-terminal
MKPRIKIISVVGMLVCLCFSCQASPASQVNPTQQITPTQVKITFQIVEAGALLGDKPKEPVFAAISTSKEWDALDQSLPSTLILNGKEAMKSYPALYLLAYTGVKGSSGYKLEITNIELDKGQYIVKVTESAPTQGTVVEPAMTLPYVLVAIPLDELPHNQKITFVFTNPQGAVLNQQEVQTP